MFWATTSVMLGLFMTVLAIAELRQPGGNLFRMPDRLFAAATFAIAFIYGMVLLASRVFP